MKGGRSKHDCLLKGSIVTLVSQVNKHRFISTSHASKIAIDLESPLMADIKHLLPIASMVFSLLNNSFEALGLKGIQQRYINILREQGLASVGGSVPLRNLISRFTTFYSADFLEIMGCQIDVSSQNAQSGFSGQ